MFLTCFLLIFAVLIACTAEPLSGTFYTTGAFLVGGFTSIVAGLLGMKIAVFTNVRTTKECAEDIHKGFVVAYRGGQVLGFVLVGLALLVLQLIIILYRWLLSDTLTSGEHVRVMFEMVSGYGLGGSTVALFGRVGGGIYTKAADVGSDLAGKNIQDLPEDSPDNPGVIADNVGDNVGDIAGMGSDLFGSLAEATCAALVIGATCDALTTKVDAIYFPLLITAAGIVVSWVTTFLATNVQTVTFDNVESVVKWQLVISTILMTGAIVPLLQVLPPEFTIGAAECTPWKAYACIMCGLWAGLIIGWVTELYTSN
jgi:H+-translocating diphosphatase